MGTFNYADAPVQEERMARSKPEAEVMVVPKRIGGSLAVFLPADFCRREGIREGQPIRIVFKERGRHPALGILKHVPYEPFNRHELESESDE
jgi:hypothetical protein